MIDQPLNRLLRHIEKTKYPVRRLGTHYLLTEKDVRKLNLALVEKSTSATVGAPTC